MKKNLFLLAALLFSTFNFYGCEVIGDIFKAGVWVGVIIIIIIIALIAFIARLFRK